MLWKEETIRIYENQCFSMKNNEQSMVFNENSMKISEGVLILSASTYLIDETLVLFLDCF